MRLSQERRVHESVFYSVFYRLFLDQSDTDVALGSSLRAGEREGGRQRERGIPFEEKEETTHVTLLLFLCFDVFLVLLVLPHP